MFYDNKNNILTNKLPKNSIGPNGQYYINFDTTNDINLWADHGYFSVRNDNLEKPSQNHEEDVNKRIIILDYPYADVIRTWTEHTPPQIPSNHDILASTTDSIDTEL